MKVETDRHSGFCGGVIRAIRRAESFLEQSDGRGLYSLGAIVHNDAELERLRRSGLTAIDYEDLEQTVDAQGRTLLIRAHGEPPKTYEMARKAGFDIVDCTCPVVLDLQKSIREANEKARREGSGRQIIIFGKIGHAEVLGLMGQADNAVVVENLAMIQDFVDKGAVNVSLPVDIFSQTTKSPSEYGHICAFLEEKMADAEGVEIQEFRALDKLCVHNTICTQVATRQARLSEFAAKHDVIIFVSGKASSNGKILSALCKNTNIRTYHIEKKDELRPEWFRPDDNVGVCGATSTPRWLLEEVASGILEIDDKFHNFASGKN